MKVVRILTWPFTPAPKTNSAAIVSIVYRYMYMVFNELMWVFGEIKIIVRKRKNFCTPPDNSNNHPYNLYINYFCTNSNCSGTIHYKTRQSKLLRNFIILILLFCTLFSSIANERTYILRHYQVKDGLSDNLITCFMQDNQGFIWIGTRDGLNRFDGYNFKVYRNEEIDSESQRYNRINHITLDREGDMWISMRLGLYKYDAETDSFHVIPSTQNKSIGFCQFDSENKLWWIENGNLIQHDVVKDTHKTFSHSDNRRFTNFCVQSDRVWVMDSEGYLSLLDRNTGRLSSHNMFPDLSSDISKRIRQLYPSKYSQELYLACESNYLKIYNPSSSTLTDLKMVNVKDVPILINCMLETSPDEIWVGTDRGIYIYHKSDNKWTEIHPDPVDPYTISSHYVAEIYQDRENGIWIGYHQNGLSYYSPFHPFSIIYPKNDGNSIKGGIVHDICTDDYGTIWVSTEDAGLCAIYYTTGNVINYSPESNEFHIAHTNIRGLAVTKDKLWVGHIIHGIDLLDIKTGKWMKNYPLFKDATTRINSRVLTMLTLKNNDLIVSTYDGIYKYEPLSDSFMLISNRYSILRDDNILREDKINRLWMGRYYLDLGDVEELTPQSLNITRLDTLLYRNIISDVYLDNNGDMWFATEGEGVIKYEIEHDQISLFTTKNGMPSNITFRILPDDIGNLWVSTAAGLTCINISNNTISTYTEDHGLITRQFNYYAGLKNDDGSLYFGTVKGLVHFHPEEFEPDDTEIKVFITAINVAEERNQTKFLSKDSVSGMQKIELKYNQSTFQINVSTLSYIAPGSTRYAYRLAGIHKEWNIIGEYNSIHFTNMNPGEYMLEIRASDITGNWTKSIPLHVRIIITPPWWASKIAYIIYVLCVLSIVYMGIRFWILRQKKSMMLEMQLFEDRKEKQLYQTKIDFFVNIAHEIRTPLTLIKVPLEKMIKNWKTNEENLKSLVLMDKNASRLIELVNQLLDFRKTEAGGFSLTFENVELTSLIKTTADRFHDLANEKGISIYLDFLVDNLFASIDKEAFTKVLSNLFSNAVKYAYSQIVTTLYVSDNGRNLIIEFTNDGPPIKKDEQEKIFDPFYRMKEHDKRLGSGLGLSLVRFLIEKHHGTIQLAESNEKQTVFKIVAPISQSDLSDTVQEADFSSLSSTQDYPYKANWITILVVDDDDEMRTIISSELCEKYNVVCCRNGEEALQILNEKNIQLIICDILMPVMCGFELLKKIRMDVKSSHIPVILLTAKTTIQAKLEGLELGADAYIDKPFSMDLLLAQISNLLTNRENIRQFYFNSPIANMKTMAYSKSDEEFLEKLNSIIHEHLSDLDFDVNTIAEKLYVSRPTLYRKIKAISNVTPHDLIKIARLKKSAELLLQGNFKIYEIVEMVGFSSQSNFWLAFTKQFGVTPSMYAKTNQSPPQSKS